MIGLCYPKKGGVMKIGIDLDGTILNSVSSIKFYADYFSYFHCNGKVRNRSDVVAQEKCFDWTKEEEDRLPLVFVMLQQNYI